MKEPLKYNARLNEQQANLYYSCIGKFNSWIFSITNRLLIHSKKTSSPLTVEYISKLVAISAQPKILV